MVELPRAVPPPPVLSSLQIVRRRAIPGRQICALTYRDETGDRWRWIVRLVQGEGGSWQVCGGGGGIGPGPQRDAPWINYAGSWGPDGIAIGGWVAGLGVERAATARLRFRDQVLRDDVERGVVLFVTSEPPPVPTAALELLAADGSVLWNDDLLLD